MAQSLRVENIVEFVKPHLEPGERVVQVLHSAYPMSQGVAALGVGIPLFIVGMRSIVLTDHRALLVKCSTPDPTPKSLVKIVPRSEVHLTKYKKGQLWIDFGGEQKKFTVLARVAGHEADFARELGHTGN
jgi:hypothetical protein